MLAGLIAKGRGRAAAATTGPRLTQPGLFPPDCLSRRHQHADTGKWSSRRLVDDDRVPARRTSLAAFQSAPRRRSHTPGSSWTSSYPSQAQHEQPEDSLELTKLEKIKVGALLKKRFQVWEIALRIGRSQAAVKAALEADEQLARHLAEVKKGKWTDLEKEYILRLIKDVETPDIEEIARKLGRTEGGIRTRLRKMSPAPKPPSPRVQPATPDEDPRVLGQDLVLEHRMNNILDGLLKSSNATEWERILAERPRHEWLTRILSRLPPFVRRLLAAPSPPQLADLRALHWEDAKTSGVYMWLLEPKSINPKRPKFSVYVSSATYDEGGLVARKRQHLLDKDEEFPLLQAHMKRFSLTKKGKFATLVTLPLENSLDPEEAIKHKQLTTVAEAVFTIWLAALTEGQPETRDERLRIRCLCPWALTNVRYRAGREHDILPMGVSPPSNHPLSASGQPEFEERDCAVSSAA